MKACAGKQLGFAVDSSRPESLTDQVSHGLREAIRNGILKVGESLPSREALAQGLKVSECVVRAALRDLASDRLVAGKPRRGHVVLAVPQERRQMLVLDVETANLGSFCSRISMVECAHAIQRQGHRVLSVVLGADSRETPYLRPLQEALRQRPDLAVVRVSSSRRTVVTSHLASCGCPYATLTLGNLSRSPGRFAGNLCHNVDGAISDMVAACVRAGVRSVLQVVGDATQHVIWRLENGELEGYSAKRFVVRAGAHNSPFDQPPKGVENGLRKIRELIAAKHPMAEIVVKSNWKKRK